MKNNWKESFEMLDIMNCDCEHCVAESKKDVINFIESLLAEQKKELMEKLQKEIKERYYIPQEKDGTYEYDPKGNQVVEFILNDIESALDIIKTYD